MPRYCLTVRANRLEDYYVDAKDENEAHDMFYNGEASQDEWSSETIDLEIVKTEKVEDE